MDPTGDPIAFAGRWPTHTASTSSASCYSALRARGDARRDSDYDVAVFLEDFAGIAEEIGQIAEMRPTS